MKLLFLVLSLLATHCFADTCIQGKDVNFCQDARTGNMKTTIYFNSATSSDDKGSDNDE